MDNDPHADSQDELRQCISELMKAEHNLADDNAGVSQCGDERLRRVGAALERPMSRRARGIVYAIGRVLAHEAMAEIAKRIIETLVRLSPMPQGRVLSYDDWNGHQNPSRVRRAPAKGAGGARWHFRFVPVSA